MMRTSVVLTHASLRRAVGRSYTRSSTAWMAEASAATSSSSEFIINFVTPHAPIFNKKVVPVTFFGCQSTRPTFERMYEIKQIFRNYIEVTVYIHFQTNIYSICKTLYQQFTYLGYINIIYYIIIEPPGYRYDYKSIL